MSISHLMRRKEILKFLKNLLGMVSNNFFNHDNKNEAINYKIYFILKLVYKLVCD